MTSRASSEYVVETAAKMGLLAELADGRLRTSGELAASVGASEEDVAGLLSGLQTLRVAEAVAGDDGASLRFRMCRGSSNGDTTSTSRRSVRTASRPSAGAPVEHLPGSADSTVGSTGSGSYSQTYAMQQAYGYMAPGAYMPVSAAAAAAGGPFAGAAFQPVVVYSFPAAAPPPGMVGRSGGLQAQFTSGTAPSGAVPAYYVMRPVAAPAGTPCGPLPPSAAVRQHPLPPAGDPPGSPRSSLAHDATIGPGRVGSGSSRLSVGPRMEAPPTSGGSTCSAVSVGSLGGERQDCAFFLKTGTCAWGDRCKFKHDFEKAPKVQFNSLGLPLRPDEPACAFYLKNASCAFGHTCKYHHPELPAGAAASAMARRGPHTLAPVAVPPPFGPPLPSGPVDAGYVTYASPPPPAAAAAAAAAAAVPRDLHTDPPRADSSGSEGCAQEVSAGLAALPVPLMVFGSPAGSAALVPAPVVVEAVGIGNPPRLAAGTAGEAEEEQGQQAAEAATAG